MGRDGRMGRDGIAGRRDKTMIPICFAPMEGLTTAVLRGAHRRHFTGIDRYYTPFLSANRTLAFKRKELRDILPENNEGVPLIPQILGNKADEVLWAIRTVADLGYREINFNLGCPMPQVSKRGKGSGFLRDPDALDRFFEEVFRTLEGNGLKPDDSKRSVPVSSDNSADAGTDKSAAGSADAGTDNSADSSIAAGTETSADVSTAAGTDNSTDRHITLTVKTRIGVTDPSEAEEIIKVYNRYPIGLLIIHPRLMRDMYQGHPNLLVFGHMLEESVHPVCYNGDIYTPQDYLQLTQRFPNLAGVMIGRGLLQDPALARQIRGGKPASVPEIRAYHEDLWTAYLSLFPDPRQAVAKMKGFWSYQGEMFSDPQMYPEIKKNLKKIKKAMTAPAYEDAVKTLFEDIASGK